MVSLPSVLINWFSTNWRLHVLTFWKKMSKHIKFRFVTKERWKSISDHCIVLFGHRDFVESPTSNMLLRDLWLFTCKYTQSNIKNKLFTLFTLSGYQFGNPLSFSLYLRHSFCSESKDYEGNRIKPNSGGFIVPTRFHMATSPWKKGSGGIKFCVFS